MHDIDGVLIADLTARALKRKITKIRNRSDLIQVVFNLDDVRRLCVDLNIQPKNLFAVDQNEIRLLRNGVVQSAGQLVDVRFEIIERKRTVQIFAVGWFDLLASRITAQLRQFNSTDAGQIAWELIDDSQSLPNGDFGITQGTIQASVDRDRTYEFKEIAEAILQLSEVNNGFDFEITWDKKFNVYYPKIGQSRPDLVLAHPGNIRAIDFTRRGVDISNKVIARGAGTGGNSIFFTASDTPSQERFRLREQLLDLNDISLLTTLEEHAAAELSLKKNFMDVPTLELEPDAMPEFGTYGLGDLLPLEITDSFFSGLNDTYRIEKITIGIDAENVENVTLGTMKNA